MVKHRKKKRKIGAAMKKHMKARMGAFKRGKMHSRRRRTGPVVKEKKQAVRIALEEARKKKLKGAPPEMPAKSKKKRKKGKKGMKGLIRKATKSF